MPTSPAAISVVVPSSGRSGLLDECLSSIRRQETELLRIELVVVNDTNCPRTRATAEAHGAHLVTPDAAGAAASRNAGMAAATREFLAFIDDDDIALPGQFSAQVRFLRGAPRFAAACGQVIPVDRLLVPEGPAWPVSLPGDGRVFAHWLSRYPQIGGTVVRREVAELVGPFDTSLRGDEDWDWHLRLARVGRVGFVPQPVLLFRQRPPSRELEELEWQRLPDMTRVWRRAILAASGDYRLIDAFRGWVGHRGAYSGLFARIAAHYAQGGGNPADTRRALLRAARASFAHTAWSIVRGGPARTALRGTLQGSSPSAMATERATASGIAGSAEVANQESSAISTPGRAA
jgi:glycosyltransferase involved in cell wall biosynthesis